MKNLFNYSKFAYLRPGPGETAAASMAKPERGKTYKARFDARIKSKYGSFVEKYAKGMSMKGSPVDKMERGLNNIFHAAFSIVNPEKSIMTNEGVEYALEQIRTQKIPVDLIIMLALRHKGKPNAVQAVAARFFAAKLTRANTVLAHIAHDCVTADVAEAIVSNKACLPYVVKILLNSKQELVRKEARKSPFAKRYEK